MSVASRECRCRHRGDGIVHWQARRIDGRKGVQRMKLERKTKETTVQVEMNQGSGKASVNTGTPFLDHMITALARYSGLDVTIQAEGDLTHHIIEDVAITVGAAFAKILPGTCSRYGDR